MRILIVLLLLAGCMVDQIDVSCTEAHIKDGWLHIAEQQIRVDKITFVRTPFKAMSKRSSYRVLIGVDGNTFYYDDNDRQACDALVEKILKAKLG